MPSIVQNMALSTEPLVTEKRNARVKPSLIMVDNVLAGADSELTFQDVFNTNASIVAATGAAVAAVVGQTEGRLRINVSDDACVSIRDELEDVEFLGAAQVIREEAGVLTANVNCHVTLGYDLN